MRKTDLAFVSKDLESLNRYKRERENYRQMEYLRKELQEMKQTVKTVLEIVNNLVKENEKENK